jgi:copper(I)-binding protein
MVAMRNRFSCLIAVAGVLLAISPAAAHDYKVGALEIKHPWVRATPKGSSVAGGYLQIVNTGTAPDRLVGGSSPIGRFEIHEMKMNNGVMQMRPLPGGLEIKPGETVELKPGSYHVMFLGLKAPVEQGKPVKATLVFEKAGPVAIEYSVEPIGSSPASAAAPGAPHGH